MIGWLQRRVSKDTLEYTRAALEVLFLALALIAVVMLLLRNPRKGLESLAKR